MSVEACYHIEVLLYLVPFIAQTFMTAPGSLTLLGLQSHVGDNFGKNCLEFEWCVPKTGLEF